MCTFIEFLPHWNNDCDLCCVYRFFSQSHIHIYFTANWCVLVNTLVHTYTILYSSIDTNCILLTTFLFIPSLRAQTMHIVHEMGQFQSVPNNSVVMCQCLSKFSNSSETQYVSGGQCLHNFSIAFHIWSPIYQSLYHFNAVKNRWNLSHFQNI